MKKISKTMCPLPFIGIYYRDDDRGILNCCMEKSPEVVKQSGWMDARRIDEPEFGSDIQKFWTSEHVQEKRRKMLSGEWPDSCDACRLPESMGKNSPRQQWRWMWAIADELTKKHNTSDIWDVEYGNIEKAPLNFDYRPDNLCNLGCAMCSPNASSVLEEMVKKNPELGHPHVLPNNIDYTVPHDENIDIALTGLSEHTRRIKLNGGEPTISKRIKKIYDYVIERDWAKNISLQFTTNFTNANSTFTDILPQFKHVAFTASLDGAGTTYDYTRHPAHWDKVSKNIKTVIDSGLIKRWDFSINCVWSISNAFTVRDWLPQLAELMNYVASRSPKKDYEPLLNINQVFGPEWQSINCIPEHMREQIRQDLDWCEHTIPNIGPKLQNAIDSMRWSLDLFKFKHYNLTIWQRHVTIYDNARGTNILDLNPAYTELMTYE